MLCLLTFISKNKQPNNEPAGCSIPGIELESIDSYFKPKNNEKLYFEK